MNENTDFSLDVTFSPGGGSVPPTDLVAFDLCRAYPMPDGNLLLHNTRTGKRAMVKPEVYATLLGCVQFSALDEHISRIVESNPGMREHQADVHRVLQTMVDSGIMLSAKKLIDDLTRESVSSTAGNVPGKPVVVIITWDRPEALERLLKSIRANCNTGNFHCLYVVDDSRDFDNIRRNQALAEQFAPEIRSPMRYYGQQEQKALLSRLVERLPEHESAIRFLADQSRWRDQWTSGLARNLALLLSCGYRLVMLDDDTVCDVYNPAEPKPDIRFSDEQREAEFFRNEQEWESRHQAENPDPVDRHMQCLGLTFAEALRVLGQDHLKPVGFANATALQVSELRADSMVLITECGSVGCPGTGGNTWLPFMPPKSLKQLQSSERETTNALKHRMAWSGRSQPHFGPRPNMSQITGFDNRHQLPPYLPIIRGEDRLFGYMLDFVYPTGVSLDYPWAIPHLPLPQREWRDEDRKFLLGESFPLFFFKQTHMQKPSCLSQSPEERLSTLSAWFKNLSAASESVLIAMFRDAVLNDGAEQLQKLNEVLMDSGSAPVQWQDYLKDGIAQLSEGMGRASDEGFVVKGVPAPLQGTDLINFWKRTWAGFADVLGAWPEIRRAATEIVDH